MIERRKSLRNDSAYMLAVLYTSGFLGMCFVVVLRDIPTESRSIVQQLISIMSMIQAAIAGYFYGASKAATESNQTVARIAEQSAPATATAAAVAASTGAASAGAQTDPIKVDTVNVESSVTNVTQPGENK